MNMKNTFEWTNPTGTKMKLEIKYVERLENEELNADGHKWLSKKAEVKVDANLTLFVNGKKVDNSYGVNFWRFIDYDEPNAVKVGLTKKIWGLPVAVTPEKAAEIEKFIADYIAANKLEKVEKTSAETKTEETEPTETKTEPKTESVGTKTKGTKSERCHKCGTYCYGDCSY